LKNDVFNCGRCGTECAAPGANEYVTCVSGQCVYDCGASAADCGDGTCTDLSSSPDNCGACGNVCPAQAPYCSAGTCSDCGPGLTFCGVCADLDNDNQNCGACFVFCPDGTSCSGGVCAPIG